MRFIRLAVLLSLCLFVFSSAEAQWSSEWTGPSVSDSSVDGWLPFQYSGGQWSERYYVVDSTALRIMTSPESQTAAYTYTFTAAERLEGNYVYSLGLDLTGDDIVDFYVLGYYAVGSTYRQGVKIFNIVNGTTIFELNDASASYGYPTILDVDNDGMYEAYFARYPIPYNSTHSEIVYQTTASAGASSPASLPQQINLLQNYPNPFNPATRIQYNLSSPGRIRLDVTNVLGQRVRTIVDGPQSAGMHATEWNGTDNAGAAQSSGPYFYRLQVDGKTLQTKKMLLVR
jgi:hypothetical protein